MDSQTVGIVAAVIAVVFSVIWVVLGVKGVRSLSVIRRALRERNTSD